jgi:hypothetical protein
MNPVIKTDGTTVTIPTTTGRGRPAKYPWSHLEVGDHFIADLKASASLKSTISTLRQAGRDHLLEIGAAPNTLRVTRTA